MQLLYNYSHSQTIPSFNAATYVSSSTSMYEEFLDQAADNWLLIALVIRNLRYPKKLL